MGLQILDNKLKRKRLGDQSGGWAGTKRWRVVRGWKLSAHETAPGSALEAQL